MVLKICLNILIVLMSLLRVYPNQTNQSFQKQTTFLIVNQNLPNKQTFFMPKKQILFKLTNKQPSGIKNDFLTNRCVKS